MTPPSNARTAPLGAQKPPSGVTELFRSLSTAHPEHHTASKGPKCPHPFALASATAQVFGRCRQPLAVLNTPKDKNCTGDFYSASPRSSAPGGDLFFPVLIEGMWFLLLMQNQQTLGLTV